METVTHQQQGRPAPVVTLMLAEAVTLAIASVIHFGVVIPLGVITLNDPFAGARIPEAILAVAMAAGAFGLMAGWPRARWFALAATLLTIVGVLVGVRFVLTGTVSRPGDLIYHGALFVGLVATTGFLLMARTPRGPEQ
jgi:hypothetical protein